VPKIDPWEALTAAHPEIQQKGHPKNQAFADAINQSVRQGGKPWNQYTPEEGMALAGQLFGQGPSPGTGAPIAPNPAGVPGAPPPAPAPTAPPQKAPPGDSFAQGQAAREAINRGAQAADSWLSETGHAAAQGVRGFVGGASQPAPTTGPFAEALKFPKQMWDRLTATATPSGPRPAAPAAPAAPVRPAPAPAPGGSQLSMAAPRAPVPSYLGEQGQQGFGMQAPQNAGLNFDEPPAAGAPVAARKPKRKPEYAEDL
jgi:hypothetical protein